MAALPTMLVEDRERFGWSVEQAARRLEWSYDCILVDQRVGSVR